MKKLKILLSNFILLSLVINQIYARWWIFGVAQDEIILNYVYINNIPIEELKEKTLFYPELLEAGYLYIKGKASIRGGKIVSVKISVDNKETWQEANLSSKGIFEYKFKPQQGKSYVIYIEAMDQKGKTNDIEQTKREIVISNLSLKDAVKQTLDELIQSYKQKNINRFSSYISRYFVGDYVAFENAVIKDFSIFDNVEIIYTINNVNLSRNKKIILNFNFSRNVTLRKNSQILSDKGTTEMVFNIEDDKLKIYSMKQPLIFGLSAPEDTATGYFNSPNNERIIVVSNGDVDLVNFDSLQKEKPSQEGGDEGIYIPKNLTVANWSFMEVRLKWDPVEKAVGYKIYEALSPTGPWVEIEEYQIFQWVSPTEVRFGSANIAMISVEKLYYCVRSVLPDGKLSEPSNVVEIIRN